MKKQYRIRPYSLAYWAKYTSIILAVIIALGMLTTLIDSLE